MEPQRARVDSSGRLVIPASVRRELELRDGDEVVFATGDVPHEIRLLTRRTALDNARALLRQYVSDDTSLVARLIAERRADADREGAEMEGWVNGRRRKRGTR